MTHCKNNFKYRQEAKMSLVGSFTDRLSILVVRNLQLLLSRCLHTVACKCRIVSHSGPTN